MRIVHIDKFLPPTGGVGSYVRQFSRLQEARGHRVMQFGCVGPLGPADMPAFEDFTACRSVLGLWRMIHNGQAARKLDAFLARWPADVAHLHNVYHHLTPAILPVLAARRVAAVMTAHDYRLACPTKHFLRGDGPCTRCLGGRFYHAASPRCAALGGAALAVESYVQRLLRRYFSTVSFFLCPTRFMRRVLLAAGVPRGKAVVLPNAIEPLSLPAAAAREQRTVLWAGRLSEEKAPQLALELARRSGDVRVVLAGDGPLRRRLEDQVSRQGLANVELAGHVEHDRLAELLARASAVVLTSQWFENSPQVMLEAMAAGRCVIVPDHPPLREFVRDGWTGRTFPPGSAEDLARVTRQVLDDPGGRRRMEHQARLLVARRHDGGDLAARLDGLYEEAIDQCGSR